MELTRRQCLAIAAAGLCHAAENSLTRQWQKIATETDGMVGAAALHLNSGQHASLHGGERFPLASVCKLPIALAILAMAGEGKLSLDDESEIPLQDVVPGVSIVAERWPGQKRFRLNELLEWMVAKSDNSAVQTLFWMSGAATGMAARFRQWQVEGMRVDRSELECALDSAGVEPIPPVSQWTPGMFEELTAKIAPQERRRAMRRFIADPRDTATPDGTVRLLQRAFRGELLPPGSTGRLVEILSAATTGSARIKGLLPAGTVVAHKTGTTVTFLNFNGATNDVGVITLPKGGQVAIAVYVKSSTRDLATREKVIASIARSAFDAWS